MTAKKKYNSVVHFEMPYKDPKRVSKFYKSVFGWNMIDAGEDMGNYIVAHTAETGKNNMVKSKGTINGGFYNLKMSPKTKEPSVVISVNNLEKAMANVKKSGGKILGNPQDIPGIGLWVSFRDTEGNRTSMLQAAR